MIGAAGSEGIGQIIRAVIERVYEGTSQFKDKTKFRSPPDVMVQIAGNIRPILSAERDAAAKAQIEPQLAAAVTLVALPLNGVPILLLFNEIAGAQEITEHLPIISIGSGSVLAQPFLGFIRKVFWENRLPGLAEGKFAAYWAMKHTLGLAAAYVAPPIRIAVLSKEASGWSARELDESELQEHETMMETLEQHVRDFQVLFHDAEDIPKPEQKQPEPAKDAGAKKNKK